MSGKRLGGCDGDHKNADCGGVLIPQHRGVRFTQLRLKMAQVD